MSLQTKVYLSPLSSLMRSLQLMRSFVLAILSFPYVMSYAAALCKDVCFL